MTERHVITYLCPKTNKHCDDEVCTSAGDCHLLVGDRVSDPSIALKLRFVLLEEKEVVCKVLIRDDDALGFVGKQSLTSLQMIAAEIIQMPVQVWNPRSFTDMKAHLSEFVEQGCFQGKKPVPRIEKVSGRFHFYDKPQNPMNLSVDEFESLSKLAGAPLPIYEPKQFKGEWRKISPREFTADEFESLLGSRNCAENATDYVNGLLTYAPEVWEFTVSV